MRRATRFPLYRPELEHDACGVGFIADLRGRARRDVIDHGVEALTRLAHRGAPASLGAVDGCGVMTAIPWHLMLRRGSPLARQPIRAAGMLFVRQGAEASARRAVAAALGAAGAFDLEWRRVPVDRAAVLPAQRRSTPIVLQVAFGLKPDRARAERALFRARLLLDRAPAALGLTVVSLSTATIVYKAVVPPDRLPIFYPDLAGEAYRSPFVVFHQRFSTNTEADWSRAQPFRAVAHNGEINTVAGNRFWMQARASDPRVLPPLGAPAVGADGSDSQSLDDAIELLRSEGYGLPHAISRLMPPAWERDREMPPPVRAFYRYQSLVSEPWDGPSALVFTDGRHIGAALDRNGFRPARVVTTAGGLLAVASETGILSSDEHEIVHRDRLGPGDMLVLDLSTGAVSRTAAIRASLAARRPYARWVDAALLRPVPCTAPVPTRETRLVLRQVAAGCSREEIDVLLRPMAERGEEAIGSMGDDTPPAALSGQPRLFTDLFRQRFAQVTNPPVDPHRESSVMSLRTLVGAHGSYLDEEAPRPPRVELHSPILSHGQLAQLASTPALQPATLPLTFIAGEGPGAFVEALGQLGTLAVEAVSSGASLLILTDRDASAHRASLPSLLAVGEVHRVLLDRGLRLRASIVVEADDARDPHQIAALCAYGASAACPALGYDTIAALEGSAPDEGASSLTRYRLSLERGLLKILSKMGVCTFSSYCGGQLFEVLGLAPSVIDRCFPGTPSPVGGLTLEDIAQAAIDRHRRAVAPAGVAAAYPGLHSYRRDGEYHASNPLVVHALQKAASGDASAYATFTNHVYRRPVSAIRDMLVFKTASPIGIDEVEPAQAIARRFFASAMSVGALSPEAHRTIASAMNRLGGRSNSGEGGEEPERFGRADGNRTKQVASARFGVTPDYLCSADELQIKMGQGSKPGEGGQLPAAKVEAHIARLRHAQPGTPLISPPVHHDIYSIEDLAELIHDLRTVNPRARMNVKLVSSTGVGIIAAGVVKAGADAIQISGHDGGTGASPRGSIKHAGMPWETGLAEAHQVLTRAGLRQRVTLQVDGGLKTGRDIAIAAALGAEEFGFGTAALLAVGCVMARQCHANTCPVGIATQRDDLRAKFVGSPDMLVQYLLLVAGEVRAILAAQGLRRLDDLVGRAAALESRAGAETRWDLQPLLAGVPVVRRRPAGAGAHAKHAKRSVAIGANKIANADRAFGAAGEPLNAVLAGHAGQSFGAFARAGTHLTLLGDANDGVGKGLHGGDIIVALPPRERARGQHVLIGNAALYGATSGRLFVAGAAGERFAVRNSGATAVVEGVGDHGCEYMTGGVVVVLGLIGRNFASGMTGGVAYIFDPARTQQGTFHAHAPAPRELEMADRLRLAALLRDHLTATGSLAARAVLRDRTLSGFRKVEAAAAPYAFAARSYASAVSWA